MLAFRRAVFSANDVLTQRTRPHDPRQVPGPHPSPRAKSTAVGLHSAGRPRSGRAGKTLRWWCRDEIQHVKRALDDEVREGADQQDDEASLTRRGEIPGSEVGRKRDVQLAERMLSITCSNGVGLTAIVPLNGYSSKRISARMTPIKTPTVATMM